MNEVEGNNSPVDYRPIRSNSTSITNYPLNNSPSDDDFYHPLQPGNVYNPFTNDTNNNKNGNNENNWDNAKNSILSSSDPGKSSGSYLRIPFLLYFVIFPIQCKLLMIIIIIIIMIWIIDSENTCAEIGAKQRFPREHEGFFGSFCQFRYPAGINSTEPEQQQQ